MSTVRVPKGYKSVLSVYETQTAIGEFKKLFETALCARLSLSRVSAPLFVAAGTGVNDNLNGTERPVEFDIAETGGIAQIVHSLAKWKRLALKEYGFPVGKGLYTDMNAIRRDEEMDNLHSIYVDQWDWEKIIDISQRNADYLKETVKLIVEAICEAHEELKKRYPKLTLTLSKDVSFVTTYELEEMYPGLSPKERENKYLREKKTAFIMQIGDKLKSGEKHDGRSPDYDDWKLNGDIVFYSELLDCAFEVSSMGIRVSPQSLDEQLTKAGADDRRALPFHKMLLAGELPVTMGGGIGQSRLSMLVLEKAHIGEVQVSIWDDKTKFECDAAGISIL